MPDLNHKLWVKRTVHDREMRRLEAKNSRLEKYHRDLENENIKLYEHLRIAGIAVEAVLGSGETCKNKRKWQAKAAQIVYTALDNTQHAEGS